MNAAPASAPALSRFAPVAPLIGWQTLLADLSLILFMVTAAAMASAPAPPPHPVPRAVPTPPAAVPRAEPVALWRAVPGAPTLGDWLAAEAPDPRQHLTVTAHYPPGGGAAALEAVRAALAGGGPLAAHARIVIEADGPPGAPLVIASLAYDSAVLAERPR